MHTYMTIGRSNRHITRAQRKRNEPDESLDATNNT